MAGSGRTLTYAELEERSVRLADHLRSAGLVEGDVVALRRLSGVQITGEPGFRAATAD